jgi:hypothetical protein
VRVTFKCPRLNNHMTRTVLEQGQGWYKVWHGGQEKIVFDDEVTSYTLD